MELPKPNWPSVRRFNMALSRHRRARTRKFKLSKPAQAHAVAAKWSGELCWDGTAKLSNDGGAAAPPRRRFSRIYYYSYQKSSACYTYPSSPSSCTIIIICHLFVTWGHSLGSVCPIPRKTYLARPASMDFQQFFFRGQVHRPLQLNYLPTLLDDGKLSQRDE